MILWADTIFIPILQLGKLRLIEGMCQAQGGLAEAVTKAPRKEKKKVA